MKALTDRSRIARRAAGWAALVVLAISTSAAPAQPASRPGGGGGGGGGGPGGPGGMSHRGGMRGGGGGAWRLSGEEVVEVLEFTRNNMPNLGKAIEQAEQGSPARMRLMRFAVERWRSLQRVQREEPDAYEAALTRLRSHDEVFDLVRQLNEAPEDERPALRAQVREKMREIMQDLLAEREQRIERLRQMLNREEDLLGRDRDNIDELTEQRVEALQREFREMGGTKSAGDLTPPDLSTGPGAPGAPGAPPDSSLGATAPATAPANERVRRGR